MKGLLIGYGSIGRRHLANFHSLGVTDWAVVRTGHGTLPFEAPGPVRVHTSLDEALQVETPDFSIIANPSNLHHTAALACVKAGSAILIEKPISTSTEGLDELRTAVASSGVGALVGFQFRFHPALQRIQEIVSQQQIGSVLHARLAWGEYLPGWQPGVDWRRSYAARVDLGGGVHHTICHPLDYLRMIFGDPSALTAALSTNGPLGLEVAEAADVLLTLPGGARVSLHLDYWSQPPRHTVDIIGTQGSLSWDYLAGTFQLWDSNNNTWNAETYPGVDQRNELFLAEARHFLDVVSGSATPVCTLDDGIRAVQLSTAIDRSAAHGRWESLTHA